MALTYEIDGALYADMVKSGAINLRNNAQTVNELNVFPVPDGDTGENMARTIEGGVAALNGTEDDNVSAVAECVAKGMLFSARGNSGVILSQFFDGMRKGLSDTRVGVRELKRAFTEGVSQAYAAVVQPTEGTILTVMREATVAAQAVKDDAAVEEFFNVFIDELYASLERTPDLLPILRESGVIDSGGAGFVYIIEGMNRRLRGIAQDAEEHVFGGSVGGEVAASEDKFNADSCMDYGYCTEVIVQLLRAKTDPEKYDVKTLIAYLESIGGDSIVAFKTDTRIKLHVHTRTPDKVLAYCLSVGEFIAVKVENMSLQHTEATVRNRFKRQTPAKKQHTKYATVAVADGDGLIEQFKSLGADCVVDGKQTMNPSAQDFITAFEEVNADIIFVLPNNANVILAAKQAAQLFTQAQVVVIPSTTIAEGYSALSLLDYSPDDIEEIESVFCSAVDSVTTGLVTYSIRDCAIGGKAIKKGDWLGFDEKKLISSGCDIVEASNGLLDKINMSDKSVITAIRGKGVTDDEVAKISAHMKAVHPEIEFYDFDGGQDVYAFIFVVE